MECAGLKELITSVDQTTSPIKMIAIAHVLELISRSFRMVNVLKVEVVEEERMLKSTQKNFLTELEEKSVQKPMMVQTHLILLVLLILLIIKHQMNVLLKNMTPNAEEMELLI